MQQQKNSLSIPAAIVIAGFLVAVGIYMSKPTAPAGQNKIVPTPSVKIKPISKDDHILGNPDAPVVIVEFSDTECPYCKSFQTTMQTIINTYGKDGKVAWVYRHFPLDSIHPKTRKEAEATECANELGGNTVFWKYIDEIFTITTSNNTLDAAKLPVVAKDVGLNVTKFNTCLASGKYADLVESQFQDGIAAGAEGTPYNVMVLKTKMSADTEQALLDYTTPKGLSPYVILSESKKEIVLTGALPIEIMKAILDIVLK